MNDENALLVCDVLVVCCRQFLALTHPVLQANKDLTHLWQRVSFGPNHQLP